MSATLIRARPTNLAALLERVGDVPLERIGFPVGTATEKDLIDYLEASNKRLFELVDGVLVEKTMGLSEAILAVIVGGYISAFLEETDLGLPFGADGPFRLRPGRVRIPDTGFIAWDRLPGNELPGDPILDGVPNLAVEVISKSNTVKEMTLKVKDYFAADVQLVWFIYPKTQTAEVYTSPRSKKSLGKDGVLDGGDVLPGFRLPLKRLFERTRRKKQT